MSTPMAIVVSPRPSLWRRIAACFDVRSKAELLALIEHERGLREAAERRNERLVILWRELDARNKVYERWLGLPPRLPVPGPGQAVSR